MKDSIAEIVAIQLLNFEPALSLKENSILTYKI